MVKFTLSLNLYHLFNVVEVEITKSYTENSLACYLMQSHRSIRYKIRLSVNLININLIQFGCSDLKIFLKSKTEADYLMHTCA